MDTTKVIQKLKAARKATNGGFMQITVGYTTLLVSHTAGVQIMQALENAEILQTRYSEPCTVAPAATEVTCTPIHENQYMALKLSHVMKIPLEEAVQIMREKHDE